MTIETLSPKSRWFCVLLFAAAALVITLHHAGWQRGWALWNVPAMSYCFGDLRTIAGARQSMQQGFDPLVHNPGDPLGRSMNYPRVWLSLALAGFDQPYVPVMGAVLVTLFLVGVWLVTPCDQSFGSGLISLALLLSPSALLCIERGNTDLLMFFLVAAAVACVKRGHVVAFATLVLTGFALKLFPVFAASRLLFERRSVLLRTGAVLLSFVGLYTFATWGDLLLIKQGTPPNYWRGYGVTTWCSAATKHLSFTSEMLSPAAYFVALAVAACCLWIGHRLQADALSRPTLPSDAFLAGSSIYVGTFLLGSNYDYRHIFLLLTIPQLMTWGQGALQPYRHAARAALACIVFAAWHTVLPSFLPLSHESALAFTLILYLATAWALYATLGFLLCAHLLFPLKRLFRKQNTTDTFDCQR